MKRAKLLYVITKDWSRHGAYSGYERLLDVFQLPNTLVTGFTLPYRFLKYFRDCTQVVNYRTDTVGKELGLLLKGLFRPLTVHVQYADMDYYFLHWLKRFPFNLWPHTLIATFHHPPDVLDQRLGYDRKQVLGALDKIVVMGPNQIPFFKPYTQASIRFIPHGIHLDYFKPQPEVSVSRQFLILGISHRDHAQNLALIQAIPASVACRFVVVMPKTQAQRYSHLDRVDLITDTITDAQLLHYYQSSAGVLLALNDCTASNSILEALASGCPLVVNSVGAVPDYIPEGSGVPVFDSAALDERLDYMIQLLDSPSFRAGIQAKQLALAQKYDWNVIAKATEDFILQ